MEPYRFTTYFEQQVLRKRPYLKREWCMGVIENAVRSEPPGRQPLAILGLDFRVERSLPAGRHVGR